MTVTLQSQQQRQSDEAVLRNSIEEVIVKHAPGGSSGIATLQRARSQFSSFYAADVVTVRLNSGNEFKIFVKDFGSFHHPKDTMKQRRDRELVVYRDILAGSGLDTAEYYGSVWDADAGRFWLLLEYVAGVPVSHLEFDDWIRAAGWLGRMYGNFAAHRESWEQCEVLVRHDRRFFLSIAEKALRSVGNFAPELGRQLEPVSCRYESAVYVMTSQPRTLVHGTYRPAQIILDHTQTPPRICPVDYEKAAIGSSLYDLTFLVDGFDPPRLHRLFEAYRMEAEQRGIRVGDNKTLTHVVDCFRLHRIMNWLAVSVDRGYEAQVINKLVGMAEEVGRLVL